MNNEILILDPVQAEKDRQIKSEGFQYHRDCILRALFYLTFSEKFKIVKKVDREILARFNTYQGTKAVHTLNYMHKMPSRKKELSKIELKRIVFASLDRLHPITGIKNKLLGYQSFLRQESAYRKYVCLLQFIDKDYYD